MNKSKKTSKEVKTDIKKFDVVGFVMDFETGELGQQEIINSFQELINNGMAWSLQGSYGRTATALIEAGHCHK